MTRSGPVLSSGDAPVTNRRAALKLALEVIGKWPESRPFDAREVLSHCPQLAEYRSAVVELAYEEYCRQRDAGRDISADRFAQRFPEFLTELRNMINADDYVAANEELFLQLNEKAEEADWPEPGEAFLGFRLIELLGRGTQSRVFRALEPELGNREVVVKVAHGGGGHEARAMGRLQHPRIVPVFSVRHEQESGLAAICMPWLGRATLHHAQSAAFTEAGGPPAYARFISELVARLNAPRMPRTAGGAPPSASPPLDVAPPPLAGSFVDAVVRIGIDVAEALAFAHGQEIFHRDVKPSNILLTADGRALLFDFNLSLADQIEGYWLGGTPPYMPPEQLQALVDRAPAPANTAAFDVFSLGVTLYSLLSGRLPFGAVDPHARIEELAPNLLERCRRGPLPLRQANPHVSPSLAALIERCLAYRPEDRPASAAALAAALARQLSPAARAHRWMRIHRRAALGILASSLAAAATGTAAWATRPSTAERSVREGWRAHRRGDQSAALRAFNDALREQPSHGEALLGRGRVYLETGEHRRASEDFQRAAEILRDGRADACLGYMLQLIPQKDHAGAARHYETALRRGFSSLGLHNNLGYCYLRQRKLDRARTHLESALQLDSKVVQPYYHLASVDLTDAMHGYLPDFRYIEEAVRLWPDNAFVLRRAVSVYAWAAQQALRQSERERFVNVALEYSERAMTAGLHAELLKTSVRLYPALVGDPRFAALLARRPADMTVEQMPVAIDPLADTSR